jgi:hypothetical protein
MTKRSSIVEIRYQDKYAYATGQLLYKVRLYIGCVIVISILPILFDI